MMIDFRGSPALRALALPGALACLAALACGAAQRPQCHAPPAITLHVHPAKHLNPDRAGLSRSVVVRFYQLADAGVFANDSFERVWAGAGGALPEPEQLIALPGRDQVQTLRREPSAQYLAVAANFRERGGGGHWRAVLPLPGPQRACGRRSKEAAAPVELELSDYALSLH